MRAFLWLSTHRASSVLSEQKSNRSSQTVCHRLLFGFPLLEDPIPVMFALRQFVGFCAVCVVALVVELAYADDPPVWQPFRSLANRPAPGAQTGYLQSFPAQNATTWPAVQASPSYVAAPSLQCPAYEHCTDASDGYYQPTVRWIDPPTPLATPGSGVELLPSDVIWHSYWAGAKESRTSGIAFEEFSNDVSLLDVSLGGRTAILRNATRNQHGLWRGWELQIEGAAQLRLNLDQDWDFDSADFRFGVPLILARDHLQYKLAYYHLSSHVGDEFLVRNPGFTRINFSRDVLVAGASYFPMPAVRLYGEAGYAFYEAEGSDQWEFQFGLDVARPGPTGPRGTPFLALNGHLREEVGYGGNFALQTGWLWRGNNGRVLRTGLHYYNGKSPQYEFFDNFEQQLGLGLWQEY